MLTKKLIWIHCGICFYLLLFASISNIEARQSIECVEMHIRSQLNKVEINPKLMSFEISIFFYILSVRCIMKKNGLDQLKISTF